MGCPALFGFTAGPKNENPFVVKVFAVLTVILNVASAARTVELGEIAQTSESVVFYFRNLNDYYVVLCFVGIIRWCGSW